MVAAVCPGMTNDYQSVDVTLGKKTQGDIGLRGSRPRIGTVAMLKCGNLQSIGDDIAVGNHDSFLWSCQRLLLCSLKRYSPASPKFHWSNTKMPFGGLLRPRSIAAPRAGEETFQHRGSGQPSCTRLGPSRRRESARARRADRSCSLEAQPWRLLPMRLTAVADK